MVLKKWKAAIVSLALSLAYVGAALAQAVGGNASISASTTSARVAVPAAKAQFPSVLIAPAVGTNVEVFYKLGDSTVVATNTSPALPGGGICLNLGPNTFIAAVTASGTATVRITQVSGCTQFSGGSGGGGTAGPPNPAWAANPTAQVGPAAVNGSAQTFMRSDAAPAINLGAGYNWTGAHTFASNVFVAGQLGSANNTSAPGPTNSGITIGGAPTWAMASLYDQAASANNRTADMLLISNSFKLRFANDARSAFTDFFVVNGGQSGITGMSTTSGTGSWQHTGSLVASTNVVGGASATPSAPIGVGSQSNVQMFSSTGNVPTLAFLNTAGPANDHIVTAQWGSGNFNLGFSNDTVTSTTPFLSVSGGQNSGITGITTNSGNGNWAHLGSFSTTGVAVFNGSTSQATASVILGNTNPTLRFNNTAAQADQKIWDLTASNTALSVILRDDGGTGTGNAYSISRVGGTATAHSFITGSVFRLQITDDDLAAGTSYTPTNAKSLVTKDYVDAQFPRVVASGALAAQAADVNQPTFYAVADSGMYRANCYVVVTQAATTSSTMPSCQVTYTEANSGAAVSDLITTTATNNLVGTHSGGAAVIQAQTGSNVGYTTSSYASSGATPMQYRVQMTLERLQ